MCSSYLYIHIVAGTCVTSDTKVVRDIHYDGHPIEERATIITRIAPTFIRLLFDTCNQTVTCAHVSISIYCNVKFCYPIFNMLYVFINVFIDAWLCNYRFGSFEIFKARDPRTGRSGPSVGRTDILHQLLDYTTSTFYPEV